MTRDDLIKMIARRDDLSFNEAAEAVEDCAQSIAVLLDRDNVDSAEDLYQEAVDILREELGLEPDYLDLVLEVA